MEGEDALAAVHDRVFNVPILNPDILSLFLSFFAATGWTFLLWRARTCWLLFTRC
jgi:hypothetical protein